MKCLAALTLAAACTAMSASAQSTRFISLDQSRTLTITTTAAPSSGVPTPVRLVYSSPSGEIEAVVSGRDVQLGGLRLNPDPSSWTAGASTWTLRAEYETLEGEAVLPKQACPEPPAGSMDQVNHVFHAFTLSRESSVLESLDAFIREGVLTGKCSVATVAADGTYLAAPVAPDSPAGIEILRGSAWGCTKAVLNAIAAGAAMVAGCGGGCGPYTSYCCTSGVAWYLSALMQVSEDCVFI